MTNSALELSQNKVSPIVNRGVFIYGQRTCGRGLQLNASLAVAWGYLGKLSLKVDEKKLARQVFGRVRSIDPDLALPWASMSVKSYVSKESAPDKAFESCSRAVQIMPLAEF
ncbi:unnamed protein product [Vicia faba]|uniref:Uncharacterized protein n=1 Tax=Vicia faba TaxID=3906 RepID=A0AAV0ZHC9_VICFA|nr:unnamed protein product [Vicia faba]